MISGARLRSIIASMVTIALVLTGCAQIPRTGPVVQVSGSAAAPVDRGIQINAETPRADASPELVLAGFIQAMAALQSGRRVARQYLTPDAAERWDPDSGVTIYDGNSVHFVSSATNAVLTGFVIGRLDAAGHYQATARTAYRHDFHLVKVAGQWRIDNPPAGMLIAHSAFESYYSRVNVFYLSPDQSTLVPEPVWAPDAQAGPAFAVQSLLEGPSDFLRPFVVSAIPSPTTLGVQSVPVDGGVAEINLSADINSLPNAQRVRMATQLALTLAQFPDIRALRILMNGQPYAVPGQDSDGTLALSNFAAQMPASTTTVEDPVLVIKGVPGRMDQSHGVAFSPLGGNLGRKWPVSIGSLAVAPTVSALAAVDGSHKQLWYASTAASPRRVLVGKDLGKPFFASDGSVWVSGTEGGKPVVYTVPRRGPVKKAHLDDAGVSTISGMSLSADGQLLALVGRQGSQDVLGLVRVDNGSRLSLTGWQPIELSAVGNDLPALADVTWTGPVDLMVLGSESAGGRYTVYTVSADGANVAPVGPSGDIDARRLSAIVRTDGISALVVTSAGTVLKYEDAWRWVQIGPATAAAYPS